MIDGWDFKDVLKRLFLLAVRVLGVYNPLKKWCWVWGFIQGKNGSISCCTQGQHKAPRKGEGDNECPVVLIDIRLLKTLIIRNVQKCCFCCQNAER